MINLLENIMQFEVFILNYKIKIKKSISKPKLIFDIIIYLYFLYFFNYAL